MDRRVKKALLWGVERAPGLFSSRLRNPVFVVGYGRSGKSLFSASIAACRGVCLYPSEANNLWYPDLYPWEKSGLRHEVDPIWVRPERFVEVQLNLRNEDWAQRLKKAFGFWQTIKRADMVINDSAMTLFLIGEIRKEFSGARFIHLVRDGRVASWLYANRQHEKNMRIAGAVSSSPAALGFPDVLRKCAELWDAQVCYIEEEKRRGNLVPGDNLLEVRYEDICRDTVGFLERVMKFLGLEEMAVAGDRMGRFEDRNECELRDVEAHVLADVTARMEGSLKVHHYL